MKEITFAPGGGQLPGGPEPAVSLLSVVSMSAYPVGATRSAEAAWPAGGTADAAFVGRLRTQDPVAFSQLYERYKSQIYNYLYRLSGSAEMADDLTHDTFLSAYENLPRLRDDSALAGWLYRIASNRFRDVLRRKRVINWLSLGDRQDTERTLLTQSEENRVPEQEVVRAALKQLKPDYAICLMLRLAEGFSTEETAQILKTTPEAVRMRLSRARQMFKLAYAMAERGEVC
ncbi:MAG TPA: sigma-70 family RNA polymerase sigma factor [Chloroflexota bacterium]|nr:sigma-70 family RNA polymerase sigma factor [Chloroflexota bacterium]